MTTTPPRDRLCRVALALVALLILERWVSCSIQRRTWQRIRDEEAAWRRLDDAWRRLGDTLNEPAAAPPPDTLS